MSSNTIKAGIVGAAGYTGAELLRLLLPHAGVDVTVVTSREYAGQSIENVFPSLTGASTLCFDEPKIELLAKCDVVFCATPHGVAMRLASELLAEGVKVIDLSADFRLKDAVEWAKWYGMEHENLPCLKEAVYGLPELYREDIKKAKLIANPGCYPTATALVLAPLLRENLVHADSLIVDAKSGVSGAGRGKNVGSLFCEVAEDFKPYAVSGHRHKPEIAQTLSDVAGKSIDLTFVPHLIPMIRGIEVTAYAKLCDASVDLQSLYEACYADEYFVNVLPKGRWPNTSSVRGSNYCHIGVHQCEQTGQAVLMAVEDNVVKGAAGQAVQNMNLMFNFNEAEGLVSLPIWP